MSQFNFLERRLIERAARSDSDRGILVDEAEVARVDADHAEAARIDGLIAEADRVRDLDQGGASIVQIQNAGCWKSPDKPAHYARRETAEEGVVAKMFPEG